MLRRVIVTVVDAEHEGHVGVGGGGRDDHLLRACVEMLLRRRPVGEEAGRLDDDVDAEIGPRKRCRVALGQALHFVARDLQRATGHLHVFAEAPEHRIVAQQMRHRLDVAEVVERHDLEISTSLECRPEEVAADPAESIYPYACFRHAGDSNYAAVELAAMP